MAESISVHEPEKAIARIIVSFSDSDSDEELKNNLETNENTKEINILLLGCTGVGKSTFINSFVNYVTYADFETALKRNLIVLIPSEITVTDKNGKNHDIRIGTEDKNEYIKTGEAQTQDVKTYVFPIADKNTNIRLIDTPGMGDPRGINQDQINCENILSYIGNLQELHAICFLLKPNESRDTVYFKYCINQIFSRLEKTACHNIIFCFTNTRGTDYNPGESLKVLKKNIEEIRSKPPHACIPSDRNIFCFDNECFRYLAAFKENVDLDKNIENRNADSWEKSVKECWKLYHYIAGNEEHPPLTPHNVRSTISVNEARMQIGRLGKPLADVAQLIQNNIDRLQRHRKILSQDKKSLEEMKHQLYMPVHTLEITDLQHPTTVCTSRNCADVTRVGEKNSWHYKQRCHEPCGLGGHVTKEIVGDPQLRRCSAMRRSKAVCRICKCSFKVHMHVYYLTKQVMKNEVDPNVQMNITNKEQLLEKKKTLLEELETCQEELEKENSFIIECSAKFAHFLQNNALTPFSDSYKEYIEYLIEREKSMGKLCDPQTLRNHESALAEYVQLKNQFEDAMKNNRLIGIPDFINSQDIKNCLENLYTLKHNGSKIKELYEVQERGIVKNHKNQEYNHKNKALYSKFANRFSEKSKNDFGKNQTKKQKKKQAQGEKKFGGAPHYANQGNNQQYNTGSNSSQNVRNAPSAPYDWNVSSTDQTYLASSEHYHQHQPNFYEGNNPYFAFPNFRGWPFPYMFPGFLDTPYLDLANISYPSLPFPFIYPGFPNAPYSNFINTSYSNYPQAGYNPEVARNDRDNKAPLLPHPITNPHGSNAQHIDPSQFFFGNHVPPQIRSNSQYFYPPQNHFQYLECSGFVGDTKTTSTGRKEPVNQFEQSDDDKDFAPFLPQPNTNRYCSDAQYGPSQLVFENHDPNQTRYNSQYLYPPENPSLYPECSGFAGDTKTTSTGKEKPVNEFEKCDDDKDFEPFLPQPNTNRYFSDAQYFPSQLVFGNHDPYQIRYNSQYLYPPENPSLYPECSGFAGGTKTTSTGKKQPVNEFEKSDDDKDFAPFLPQPNTNRYGSNAQYDSSQLSLRSPVPSQIRSNSQYLNPPQNHSQYPEWSRFAGDSTNTSTERKQIENEFDISDDDYDDEYSRPVSVESKNKSGSRLSLEEGRERYVTTVPGGPGVWQNNEKQDGKKRDENVNRCNLS